MTLRLDLLKELHGLTVKLTLLGLSDPKLSCSVYIIKKINNYLRKHNEGQKTCQDHTSTSKELIHSLTSDT